jgi:hypothetical protein
MFRWQSNNTHLHININTLDVSRNLTHVSVGLALQSLTL